MAIRFYKIYDFLHDGAEPQAIYSARTIEIENKRICLTRMPDGYYAIDDACPHAGARLGLGKCTEDHMIICPIHRYQYNLKTGKGLPKQGDYVNTYPVEMRKDGIYVGFEKKWWQF
ncbi:MAG: nitrite reductase (NAD(P)H) small subunit [Sphingobacteriales bacterium]|jgi:3-phenylpropionate/trans-cinnamate dioxygenase ferredoxin subunit|nr:nitrite reductase (NAD(P)H) small subunit [Sphingobacteriales bacterium]